VAQLVVALCYKPEGRADSILNLHMPIVLKSGSLSLLEPSGPVQACNGIALPFTAITMYQSPPQFRRTFSSDFVV